MVRHPGVSRSVLNCLFSFLNSSKALLNPRNFSITLSDNRAFLCKLWHILYMVEFCGCTVHYKNLYRQGQISYYCGLYIILGYAPHNQVVNMQSLLPSRPDYVFLPKATHTWIKFRRFSGDRLRLDSCVSRLIADCLIFTMRLMPVAITVNSNYCHLPALKAPCPAQPKHKSPAGGIHPSTLC